ncbi:hypothetical protein [Frankia sp. QA3]|uniref:hypothetical protein n=1 Tax=Frankia sp. QA3 TaxID=710111 RepID=UPI000269C4A4|nr:hypothetical protein [Frankia sp. QA3]EIV94357.1 hypothetical protein FraQA3DRAFT_4109 [Frankia sp. QA3]
MTDPPVDAGCPVCLRPCPPAGAAAACATCGWVLAGPPVLGEVTAALTAAFTERLDTARRRFDLLGVARVLALPNPGAPLDPGRLTALVRGGAPRPGELDAARAAVAARATPGAGAAADVLDPLVARLADGTLVEFAVVEFTPDAVLLRVLDADAAGTPRLAGVTERWDWSALLPGVSADADWPETRWLRMAGGLGSDRVNGGGVNSGGVGRGGCRSRAAGWAAALRPALDTLAALDRAMPLVLLRRVDGWSAVDAAEAALAAAVPGRDVSRRAVGTGPGPLGEALRAAPARHDLALVVAEVDSGTRLVTLATRPLFAAGTRVTPGAPPPRRTVELALPGPADGGSRRGSGPGQQHGQQQHGQQQHGQEHGPGHGQDVVTLAVVAGPTAGPPGAWLPVAAASLPLPAGTATSVEVELVAAGRFRFTAAGRTADGAAPDWPALLARVPAKQGADPVDVVFGIELGGDDPVAATARLRLAVDVVELVGRAHPDPGAVRIGAIGYDDHVFDDTKIWRRPVIRPVAFASAAAASRSRLVDELVSLRPSPRLHAYAAPIEDAVHELAQLPWRAGAARVFVTLGALPPHPADRHTAGSPRCTRNYDWRTTMDTLVDTHGLRRVAVRGTPEVDLDRAARDAPARADDAWRHLGADALLAAEATDAARLAEACGVLPAVFSRPLPVPLAAGPAAGTERAPW